jgi:foldase protein PrsA
MVTNKTKKGTGLKISAKSALDSASKERSLHKKTTKPFFLTKKAIAFFLILVVIGILYLSKGLFIAATVNGKPIFRYQIIRQLEKESGKRVLENSIVKELILQAAKSNNYAVSDSEIDKQIEDIRKNLEQGGTNLDDALKMEGQTMESLRDALKLQRLAEMLVEDKTFVSEEEIEKYFNENKQSFGEDTKYEAVKDQISSQLKSQKFQTEIEKFLTDLRNKYKIIYFVNY